MVKKYIKLHNVIWKDNELSGADFQVYSCLASYANWSDGMDCFPDQSTIMSETNLAESTVKRALLHLRKKGYVVRIRKGSLSKRKSNQYELPLINNNDPRPEMYQKTRLKSELKKTKIDTSKNVDFEPEQVSSMTPHLNQHREESDQSTQPSQVFSNSDEDIFEPVFHLRPTGIQDPFEQPGR